MNEFRKLSSSTNTTEGECCYYYKRWLKWGKYIPIPRALSSNKEKSKTKNKLPTQRSRIIPYGRIEPATAHSCSLTLSLFLFQRCCPGSVWSGPRFPPAKDPRANRYRGNRYDDAFTLFPPRHPPLCGRSIR